MKRKIESLSSEIASILPFVAFEIDGFDDNRALYVRAIIDGELLCGNCHIDEDDESGEDELKFSHDLDNLSDEGLKAVVKSLERLGEQIHASREAYLQIHETIDWLRSNY